MAPCESSSPAERSLELTRYDRRSFDLDWSSLDAELTSSTITFLTTIFASAPRPSFLGEITVSSFSFGDTEPDIELLDIRDVDKEFLAADEDDSLLPIPLPSPPTYDESPPLHRFASSNPSSSLFTPGLNPAFPSHHTFAPAPPTLLQPPTTPSDPSLQVHLRVSYSGPLSVTLSTSLLINYPSPLFMSLPLKLQLTSLAFSGVFLIAFEGDRRRVHLSLLDPGATGERIAGEKAGSRLLTNAVVESEVGQAEKHVLKNVGKVEKFVLDVVRGALESELVFP